MYRTRSCFSKIYPQCSFLLTLVASLHILLSSSPLQPSVLSRHYIITYILESFSWITSRLRINIYISKVKTVIKIIKITFSLATLFSANAIKLDSVPCLISSDLLNQVVAWVPKIKRKTLNEMEKKVKSLSHFSCCFLKWKLTKTKLSCVIFTK